MFLGWCDEELTPGGKVKKLNARLTTPEAMTGGKTFRQRTAEFWQWFADNEPRLAAMIEKRGEEDVENGGFYFRRSTADLRRAEF